MSMYLKRCIHCGKFVPSGRYVIKEPEGEQRYWPYCYDCEMAHESDEYDNTM